MKKTIITLLTIMLVLAGGAQIFAQSQAGLIYLLISPGARAVGMGESFVATADDATATYWNPAGLAFMKNRHLSLMHTKWLPQLVDDMSYNFVSYTQEVESLGGTIGGNIIFMDYGQQYITMENGPEIVGTFGSWDMAVTLSYGSKLSENLGIGVNMKYMRSNLANISSNTGAEGKGVANAFAVDLGVLYHMPFLPGLTFGANLSNMGPSVSYIDPDQADPLPTNLKLGFSYKVLDTEFNQLRVSVDTNKLLALRKDDGTAEEFYVSIFRAWTDKDINEQLNELTTIVGAEYLYNNMIALRAGYYYDQIGQMKYPTFGAGIRYGGLMFDFGYMAAPQGHPRSDTMLFSLSADI